MLFLGHATGGQSTLARMLGAAYPVLADDAVFAAKRPDGRWGVVDGGFRFGEGDFVDWQKRICRQIDLNSVPLRGCLRIHKAPELRIGPMDPVELARYLMDAAMEIDLQRKFGPKPSENPSELAAWHEIMSKRRQWFRQVAELARNCPGWHLWFAKETSPRELLDCIQKA